MLTLDDALRHLGYDVVDENITKTVGEELQEAESYLRGAVGDDIFDLMPDDPRVNTLLKAYLDDLHDERGTRSAKASNAKREMVHSNENNLRVELTRKRKEQEGAIV